MSSNNQIDLVVQKWFAELAGPLGGGLLTTNQT
jgi:hypothetical protein